MKTAVWVPIKVLPNGTSRVRDYRRWLWLITYSVIVAVTAAATFTGLPLLVPICIATVPWVLVLGRMRSYELAIPTVLISVLWMIVVILLGTRQFGWDIVGTIASLSIIVGISGAAYAGRQSGRPQHGRRLNLFLWVPPFIGAGIWMLALAVASGYSRIDRIIWVMQNDAANNLIYAREVLSRSGISVGAHENPVPLPSALMAISMAPGRAWVLPQSLLEHDLMAFAQIWGVLIALTCILTGLVVASVARLARSRQWLVGVGGALGSLLPLTWLFTGYPMDYGFINAHVSLVILLSATMLWLYSDRSIVLAITGLLAASTMTLAVWSPLVVVPLAFALALIVQRFRAIIQLRGQRLILLSLGLAQLIAYGIIVALPPFISQRGELSQGGGIYDMPRWVVFASGITLLVLGFLLYRRFTDPRMLGMTAVVSGGWVALGILLYMSRRGPDPWTYYPLKLSWLLTLLYLVALLGVIVGLLNRIATNVLARIGTTAVLVVLVAGVFAWLPPVVPWYTPLDPVERVLGLHGSNANAHLFERIVTLANPRQARVVWQSRDLTLSQEGLVNIWMTELWARSLTENQEVRVLGLSLNNNESIEGLCKLSEVMGPGLEVHTADPTLLQQRLLDSCPSTTAQIVLER